MRHLQFVFVFVFFMFASLVSAAGARREENPFWGTHPLSLMPPATTETPGDEHGFFLRLSAGESFPAWENFVPTWQQNFQRRYRFRNRTESVEFALSEECRPGCEGLEISADVRQGDVAIKPVSPKDVTMRLTDGSLDLLKHAGVPEEVLSALARLKDRSFQDEALFAAALLQVIGEEHLKEYQELVLQNSSVDNMLNSPLTLTFLNEREERNRTRRLKVLDNSFLSDKDISKYLFGERTQGNASKSVSIPSQTPMENWFSELRAFCDKWGLPHPRTLLLLLLLFYLTASLMKSFIKARQ